MEVGCSTYKLFARLLRIVQFPIRVRFSATVGHLSSYFALVFFYDLELDLDSVRVNKRAKYLDQSHLVQKVIVQSHT